MEEIATVDLKSPVAYRAWHRILSRGWKPHLSPSEYSLVDMIFDRTFGWGKEWEHISYEQFEKGITSREGRVRYTGGTGLSRSTIKRCIQHLESFGCIFIVRFSNNDNPGESLAYSLNYEWTPPMLAVAKLKKPRSLGLRQSKSARLGGVQNEPEGGSKRTPGGVQNDPLRVPSTKEERKIEESDAETPASIPELIHAVRENRKEAFTTLITSLLANRAILTKSQVEIIWTAALDEYFPEVRAFKWKDKEALAMITYVKRYVKSRHKETFGFYLSWSVQYWRTILIEQFGWMKSLPELPSVLFFVRFSDKFEQVFARRKEIEAILAMPARDRLIRESTLKGKPFEVAIAEVDEKLNASRTLTEIEKSRESLNKERTAFAREQTAPLKRETSTSQNRESLQPVAKCNGATERKRIVITEAPALVEAPDRFGEFSET